MANRSSTKILLMDDDTTFALYVQERLHAFGYDVDTVRNANDAWALIKEESFDLVISDMIVRIDGTPVPDGGVILLHRLQRRKNTGGVGARLPVIAVSGATHSQGLTHILSVAEQLGADAVLSKPFDISELVLEIEALVGQSTRNG